MARVIDFRLLGPFEVTADGHDVTPTRPKQQALLAFLLLRANQLVSTEELIEGLWEEPPGTAPTALHGHVSALRKALGTERIETRPSGYVLHAAQAEIDYGRFEALVARAREVADPQPRAAMLREALGLFRGEPLADFRYEAFAADQTARLDEMRQDALEERLDAELELGRHAELVPELERLVAQHPLRERVRSQLMLALYRAGRPAQALHKYQEGRRKLSEELGIEPGPLLQALERQILTHDPALTPAPPERPASFGQREQRKLVTILFCDLVSFTARAELLDPEDVWAILQPYYARLRAELERFGGTVEKFVGDAVMAVFGSPLAHEDDAERAVRAALAIREAIAGELEVRIGIQTGEVLIARDGDSSSGERFVAGDVVNTAARLQAGAPIGGILVGEPTYQATRAAIEYRDADPVVAKGKRAPIPVWQAVAARSPLAVANRTNTPLVGRDRELHQLMVALARVRAEHLPQLLTVVGVPGIGKTRLIFEFSRRVRDVIWLQGRSLPYGDGISFWALGEIVKAQASVLETDGTAIASAKLDRAVADAVADPAEAQRVVRHLRPLLGLGDDAGPAVDSQREAFAVWRTFFEGIAERTPLVVALEDVHWADDGLLEFIDELVERASDVALLVICTARPELLERRPKWAGGKRNASTVSLTSLSSDETERLMDALLEDMPLAGDERSDVLARAEGNPLYAEEYARLIREQGAAGGLPTPQTLHALIAARLDTLSAAEKALVQDAAVVGEVVWLGAIAALGGAPAAAFDPLLRALERKEFLRRRRRTSVEGQTEYAFAHVLVRDVAYSQIPRGERGEKHQRAAEWIESLGRREDHAELVAHHYARALELARLAGKETGPLEEHARLALRDAGDRAARLGAFSAARQLYEAAIKLWPQSDPERAHLFLRYARTRHDDENLDEAVLEQAYEGFLDQGDRESAAEAQLLLARTFWARGTGELVRQHLGLATQLVDATASPRLRAAVLTYAARFALSGEETEKALLLAAEALPLTERLNLGGLRSRNLNTIGTARMAKGDLGGADDLHRAIVLALEIRSGEAWIAANNLAWSWALAGDLRLSYELRKRSREIAAEFGLDQDLRWERGQRVYHEYVAGHWHDAKRIADQFIAEVEAGSPHYLEWECRVWRGSIRLARGDLAGGLDDADRALAVARMTGEPQALHPTLPFCGLAALAAGRGQRANEFADAMLQGWRQTPMEGVNESASGVWLFKRLGRTPEFEAALERVVYWTPWHEAAKEVATGDPVAAADRYAEIGSMPDEAYARLIAGQELGATGRPVEAEVQLGHALAFYRSVGATEYVRMAEELLAARA